MRDDAIAAPRPRSEEMYSDSFMLRTVARCYVDCKHHAIYKRSKMLRMKTVDEIRYENLTKLLADFGDGDLTKMLEKSKSWHLRESENRLNRQNLDQILKKRTTASGAIRGVGDELARKIEEEFRLERGWMDNPREMVAANPRPSGIRADILVELIQLIDQMTDDVQGLVLEAARNLREASADGLIGSAGDKAK